MEIEQVSSMLEKNNLKRVVHIVKAIQDPKIKTAVIDILGSSLEARESLERVELKPFEAASYEMTGATVWQSVSVQVYGAFMKVGQLIAVINQYCPAVEESAVDDDAFDMAFAELDDDAFAKPTEARTQDIDALFDEILDDSADGLSQSEEIWTHLRSTCSSVAAVLKSEIGQFNRRISLEAVFSDRWNLLGEIQETKHRLTKGIGALLTGVCSIFEPVRKEDVVPNYHTLLSSALLLRTYFLDMRLYMQEISNQMKEGPETEWRTLTNKVYIKVEETIFSETFDWMRPLDKRVLIDLRNRLHDALESTSKNNRRFYEVVEDTLRFSEAMNIINSRESLIEHDQEALNIALLHLQAAEESNSPAESQSMQAALAALFSVRGRDMELDRLVAKLSVEYSPEVMQELMTNLHRVLGTLIK